MSFTDQKQRTVTEQDCNANWGGHPKGAAFRCHLCGHKFVPGDLWRWIYSPTTLNFKVCKGCDTFDNQDLIGKYVRLIEESKRRFWWLHLEIDSLNKELRGINE